MDRIGSEGRVDPADDPDLIGGATLDAIAPATEREPAPAKPRKGRLRAPLLIIGVIALIVFGLWFYLSGGRYEATEDSALQAGQGAVSANVSGQVISIEVHENQSVKAGQVLFRIDPQPYQAAVDEAAAKLADARTAIQSKRADIYQGEAQIGSAQAQLDFAIGEAARQKQLLAEGISSKSQYDQAVLAVRTARQAIATAAQQTQSVRASIGGGPHVAERDQPTVQAAFAVLERAKLNLGYTTIRAAQDGTVTRVNQLQVGNYVTAAKPVFTLVGKRVWVEANFKESQLAYMRVGQPATVKIDAYADRELRGHVKSFSPGTGNSFSLLPAENATGNWVKVVQRLPVEIEFDNPPADLPLHAGLSADVTVDTGHVRHLFGPPTQAPKPQAAP